MMYGDWGMGHWGFGVGHWLFGLIFLIIVVAIVVVLVRAIGEVGGGPRSRAGSDTDRALDILRERYARGEIDREEFEAKQRDLKH